MVFTVGAIVGAIVGDDWVGKTEGAVVVGSMVGIRVGNVEL